MATSPTHKFGQIIGDLLEAATVEKVRPIANKHRMYLDYIHPRPTRDGKKKIHVQDVQGNYHDLDLVIEEGGSETVSGTPRAFIEVAWRRYTKHSKNKVQEISSAVLACAKRYEDESPFTGTVLAGEFTDTSLAQLKSQGFVVVHFPLADIVAAFAESGIDAYWEENTPDHVIEKQVNKYNSLSHNEINRIKERLFQLGKERFDIFTQDLDKSLERHVEEITVSSLWGISHCFETIADARDYITHVDERRNSKTEFIRFEIEVIYTNGSSTSMVFTDKNEALRKLALMEQ